jgi:hypothetical protein
VVIYSIKERLFPARPKFIDIVGTVNIKFHLTERIIETFKISFLEVVNLTRCRLGSLKVQSNPKVNNLVICWEITFLRTSDIDLINDLWTIT